MRHSLAALCLMLVSQPALVGIKTGPSEADTVLAMMRAQYNGLEGFLPLSASAAVCDRNQPPVTRAMLVAMDRFGPITTAWLSGPKNDTNFRKNALVARGADPANILRLSDNEATYGGIIQAANTLLNQTNCGDSVIMQFTGFAFDEHLMAASKSVNGPFSTDEKTLSIATYASGLVSKTAPQDWIIGSGPFLVLNQRKTGKGDILSAAAIPDLVTLFRNRGAGVSVVLDITSSETFRVEDWQARANIEKAWRERYEADDAGTGRDPFPPRPIAASAGALSVYYGTATGETGAERKLPKGAKDRNSYGQFSFDFASALLLAERTTAMAMMRQIKQSNQGYQQSYVFTATDPDHDLVAEARPAAPITKGEIQILDPAPTRTAAALKEPRVT